MAQITCNFHSNVLGMAMSMSAVLPQGACGKPKTLYLLHGLSDDHTIWLRRTSIERYADAYGIAVVMPNGHRSFYTDMAAGQKYFTYIADEVPSLARQFFNLSDKREDNFVAGLSMGGYGAFKLAMTYPERYIAGASLSGVMNISEIYNDPARTQEMYNIFGNQDPKGGDDDIYALADRLVNSNKPAPLLYQCCGTEDFLYQGNIIFRDHAEKIGLKVQYEEGPGSHEWGYWDRQIKRVLEWIAVNT